MKLGIAGLILAFVLFRFSAFTYAAGGVPWIGLAILFWLGSGYIFWRSILRISRTVDDIKRKKEGVNHE